MFWKFNLITTSHVETVLNKENVTLSELMDEDDIIQECKAQNKKLIDYIVQSEVMDELVSLITQEPSIELDEVVRYKYPNIACEILTSDVCAINDALAGDQALLSKLMSFLDHKDQNTPLNPLLASFFSKTVSLLITRKTEPMFEFLQGREEFVPLLLEHFDTSAVTDLLLRLITCTENNDTRAALVKWLSEQQLVERLVALIRPCQSEERNTNAAQVLCDIVRVCREYMSLFQENADPDPLLQTIESSETISTLLGNMLDGDKKESVLVSGILVILALLEFKKQGPAGQYHHLGVNHSAGGPNSSQVNDGSLGPDSPLQCFASLFFRSEGPEAMTALDAERLTKAVTEVITALLPRIEDLIQLLKNPPQKPSYSSISLPPIEKPVGFTRLEVAHLLSALLNTNTHDLNLRLTELNTLPILLDMFFSHSWNNFLHTQVEQAVGTILRNAPTLDSEDNQVHPLLDQLFIQCKIVQRILDTWEENEHEQSQPGKHRRGYMGHLTNIANHLARSSAGPPNCELIQSKLSELPEDYCKKWETFVTETLSEINNRNQTPLVSGISFSALDGDNVDFRELHVPFQQEKHAFSDYQMETMTNSFDDQFGFNDEEFVETDENIPDPLSRVNGNFHLVAEENMTSAELFEQACCEHIATLGDTDSDEEVWDDKENNYVPGVALPAPLRRLAAQGSASSLEENSRDCDDDNSSDSPHVLSNPIGIVGVSDHSTPDSSIPITGTTSGSIVSLGSRSTFISSAANQTRHIHDDQTMDVDSSDVWSATFSASDSTAMDTSSPWNGEVVSPATTVISVPQATASSDNQGWADFSCFKFSNSDNVATVSQANVETSKKHSNSEDESIQTSATSQSRDEGKPGLPSLNVQPLANGQLPIMSSGPVVVVVGNPTSSSSTPVEDFQQQVPSGIPATPPTLHPSPMASSKMSDDPARTSASTHQPGSTEEGSHVTETGNNPVAAEPLTTPLTCLQNGPV